LSFSHIFISVRGLSCAHPYVTWFSCKTT